MNHPKQVPKPLLEQLKASQYEQDKRFDILLQLVDYLCCQHFLDDPGDDHPEYITLAYICLREWHNEVLDRISDFDRKEV